MEYECYNVVDCNQFSPSPSQFWDISKRRYHRELCQDYVCLDTETSWNKDEENPIGWVYQWCFSFQGNLVCGRTMTEMVTALTKIIEVNNINDERRISIFVHNLSYDYEYIKEHIKEALNDRFYNLAVAKHKIISSVINGLLFKCTFRLTGKSLDAWSKELGTKHRKLVGTVDYDEVHYQDSELTNTDWKYMWNDVIVLDESIDIQMKIHDDDLRSLPLTVTGYVRREARIHFAEDPQNRIPFLKMALSYEQYLMCKFEFSGGITHGNRFLAGKIVTVGEEVSIGKTKTTVTNIKHRDFASHYPSQQRCYQAPCSKFIPYWNEWCDTEPPTVEELLKMRKDKCLLIAIEIENLELRDRGITLPYAQACKFQEGKQGKIKTTEDNGRLLKMEGKSIIVVNEIDLYWLYKQYKFEYTIVKVERANKGAFPKWLIDTVDEFFYGKTAYKQQEKSLEAQGFNEDTEEWIANHRELMISKGNLNGVYGMSATDLVREAFEEDDNGEWTKQVHTTEEATWLLRRYYDNRNSFMSYQLGCWTTANARNELMEFVELIGYDHFLYADTDSIFYITDDEIEDKIEERNKEFRDIDDANGYYIEYEGKRTYYNQFELEKEEITRFKFLHAKCYAYDLVNDEMKVVIAGVSKYGRNENSRVKELGSLEKLKTGTKFVDCGGTRVAYIHYKPDTTYVDGHLIEYGSSAIIMKTDKTLKCGIELCEADLRWEVVDAV